VGDVRELLEGTDNCFITGFDANEIAEKLRIILNNKRRSDGRKNIGHLEQSIIAGKLINVYKSILKLEQSLIIEQAG
jgi:glycosyltransferase involved in cell wall biosynthesis